MSRSAAQKRLRQLPERSRKRTQKPHGKEPRFESACSGKVNESFLLHGAAGQTFTIPARKKLLVETLPLPTTDSKAKYVSPKASLLALAIRVISNACESKAWERVRFGAMRLIASVRESKARARVRFGEVRLLASACESKAWECARLEEVRCARRSTLCILL